jgi:hypothetical protein
MPVWPDWSKFRRFGAFFCLWSHFFLKNIGPKFTQIRSRLGLLFVPKFPNFGLRILWAKVLAYEGSNDFWTRQNVWSHWFGPIHIWPLRSCGLHSHTGSSLHKHRCFIEQNSIESSFLIRQQKAKSTIFVAIKPVLQSIIKWAILLLTLCCGVK